MPAYLRSTALPTLALDALVGAEVCPGALLAPTSAVVMLAYLRSAAFPAPSLLALMGAELPHSLHWLLMPCGGRPGHSLHMVMLAYLRSAALLALALVVPMLAFALRRHSIFL